MLVKFVQLPPLPFSMRAHGTVPDGTLEGSLAVLIEFIETLTSVLLRIEKPAACVNELDDDT